MARIFNGVPFRIYNKHVRHAPLVAWTEKTGAMTAEDLKAALLYFVGYANQPHAHRLLVDVRLYQLLGLADRSVKSLSIIH